MGLPKTVVNALLPAAVLSGIGAGFFHSRANTTVFRSDEDRLAIVRDLYHGPKVPQLIVVKAEWCAACKTLEERLAQLNLPYIPADVDKSAAARKLQQRLSQLGQVTIPQLIYKRDRVLSTEIGSVLQELAKEAN